MRTSWLKSGVLSVLLTVAATPLYSDVTGADLPDFGDSSGSLISPTQEMELGEAFISSIRAQATLVTDPDIDGYVQQLGYRLAASSDAPGYPFTFFVVENAAINAFAGPGGYIGIHTGLILSAENESELAGVIAHEIAHVTQRHLLRAYESANQLSLPTAAGMIAAILLGIAGNSPDAGIAGMTAIQGASIQHQLNFTRSNESEADRIGIQTLARSGIDPYGMPRFFEKLHQSTRLYGNNMPEFLSTHPVTTSRIAESMTRAESYGHGKEVDTLEFRLIRARLQALETDNPTKALRNFQALAAKPKAGPAERYGLALAYGRNNDYAAAKKQLKTLLENDPDRRIYRTTLAQFELDSNEPEQALRLYRDTLKLYPGDLIVGRYFASALIQTGHAEQAREQALKMLRNKRARTAEIYGLWAKAASVAGPPWETNVASAEVYYLLGNLHFAIDQLNKALQYKDLSRYNTERIEARLNQFKQFLQAREQH